MALETAAQAAEDAAPESRSPFVGQQYRWWWAMTLGTSLAIGVQIVTVPTYVLDRTDTRFYVALAILCQTVPAALFTLIGGAAADRFGRGRILRLTLTAMAAAATAYLLLEVAGVRALWPVFVIGAVTGTASAFSNPSRQSLINQFAPGARLQNGVIWGTLAFMGGQSFIGPALAGVTVWLFGLRVGFALAVVLVLSALVCVTRLRIVDQAAPARGSLIGQIGAGLRYVRETERLWQVLVLGAVPGLFFIGVAQATYPVFARDVFDRGAGGLAALNVSWGAGVLAGSVLLAKFGPRTGRGRWLMRSLPVGGATFVLTGLAPWLPVAMLTLLLFGLSAAVFINFAGTLLQTYAEPAYIGRVMSIYSLCVVGTVPLGNLHAGIGVQIADPRIVFIYSGAIAIALGGAAFVRLRAVRTLN